MVWDTDEIEPAVAAWEQKAQCERLRCRVCAMRIPYGDRDAYFRTKMCGYCAHQAEKKESDSPCREADPFISPGFAGGSGPIAA